jgi:hypothetical protein
MLVCHASVAARPTRLICMAASGTAATSKRLALTTQLRFEERNAHKQCKSCNAGAGKYTAKESTVAQQYEAGLVARYGQEYVDWLNGPHEMTNYRREDFIRIRDEYRAKLKALKQREAA